ncbi:IS3 family transposase [Actinomadura nitritigenes]|uniref:IS3 family transposase n=1 Tax=Actinomadura nitritigenes TaxID=134602 RepID=UPI003D8EC040
MGTFRYPVEFHSDAVALVRSSGRPIAQVAKELGVNHETLRTWVRAAQAAELPGAAAESAKDAELARLRKEVAELKLEREILRKAAAYFGSGDVGLSRFSFVEARHRAFGVKRLCRVLGVSRSGFYRWRQATAARAARKAADRSLAERIRKIHAGSGATYGSPRVHSELRDQGHRVNRERVERVMREHAIVGRHLRRRCRTTVPDRSASPVPDLLRRDFSVGAADVRWCGDVTYLPVAGRWMYLATVIDIGTRRLFGYSMAEHMRAELVVDALNAAVATRGGNVAGVIFTSDHGAQYTSRAFAEACAVAGVRRSMGVVGSSADNSLAEAFFASLKREILPAGGWPSTGQARMAVFRWLTFYNTRRRHSALGYLSPVEYEQRSSRLAAAA